MLFWKRKRSIQVADPAVLEDVQGSGDRSLTFDTLVEPGEPTDVRPNTSLSSNGEDGDRFGLFVLADQEDDDPDAIDIVALHGLNGHREKTWQATATNSKGQHLMWLRDFLPQQIPHARIMSFGYDSVLMFSKSVSDIGTFAEQLLEALMSRRRGSVSNRPIIFICHSLGGIVVKKVGFSYPENTPKLYLTQS
jgi:hypothetical protein